MHKISVANRRFVEDYGDVLRHHVECILKSGMILDEDMNLLTTFWDPTLIPRAQQQLVLTSTTFAAAGLIASLKLQNAYPIALSLIPATIQLLTKAFCSYRERSFKKEFQRLLKVFREIYRLNKEVFLYYSKRDLAVANDKLHMKAYQLLLKPGEDFLKFSIMELLEIIEQIKLGMEKVCDFVPISEGQFICSLELNLDNYKVINCESFQEMKAHFTKLTNLYLLVSSNFLGCVGLSMCVQLWKEPCSFRKIFTELLPNMVRVLEASYTEIKSRFNIICFNLCQRVTGPHLSDASRTLPSQFVKPLMEFLLNVQITFDKGRHMQLLLEEQLAGDEEFVDVLQEAQKHIEISKDCLQILTRRIDALASRKKANTESLVMPSTQSVEAVETATCDELAELKDEEYNLSIHGSDDCVDYFEDLEDISSNEDFSMLLLELKKKLLEKRGKVQEDIPVKEVPAKIPVVNHSKDVNSLLKNVMLTAQKLNRTEEVFGSGSISNCDSDDS